MSARAPASSVAEMTTSNLTTGHLLSHPSARLLAIAGALAWILATIQYGLAQVVVAAAWPVHYSWTGNYISDLGNTACGAFAVHGTPAYVCSPDHALMNTSFVLSGVLTAAGTILLWRIWPRRRLTTCALVLLLIAAGLKMVVGFVPENTSASLHLLGGANLPLESVAILALSIGIYARTRRLAVVGLVCGTIGVAGALLSSAAQTAGSAFDLGLGAGGMERVAGYPGNIWTVVVAIAILQLALASGPLPLAGDARRSGLSLGPA
jgi:hypothetical membrane protein